MAHVFWLTGLPAAGKTTLGTALQTELQRQGRPCLLLDGDALRAGLNRDLGFSPAHRDENIRRTAEIARIAQHQGFDVVCCLVSPSHEQRQQARQIVGPAFVEVFVDCAPEVCQQRDPKGLWARALSGQLDNFTGVGQPYERPLAPDFHYRSDHMTPGDATTALLAMFEAQP